MLGKRILFSTMTVVIPFVPVFTAQGRSSWPDFHGPGRSNKSPERGLLKTWPKDGPPLRWIFSDCGRGYAGVVIAEGKIFTAGDFGKQELIVALDLDGKQLWTTPNGRAWRGSSPGARAAPTYDQGTLYHLSPMGRLAAFKAPTGEECWAVDLKERFAARYGIWALAEHVIVDGNRVLCMPGGAKGRVVALDKNTGKILWTNTEIEHSAAYCSGTVVTYGGKRQFISLTQRSVVGVDVVTGELLWSAPFRPMSPQNALTPVFHDGHVFIACGHSSGGSLMKIDMNARTAVPVWHRRDLDDCHSGALLTEGKLFGCSCRQGGRAFYCVDYASGKTLKLDPSMGKVGITWAEDKIYALNHRGTLYLLAVTPEGFERVSEFALPKKPTNSYLAHPVVCDGTLYLRCNENLYAYDIRAAR